MKNITAILKLVRFQNLAIMAAIMLVFRFGFLLPVGFEVYLTNLWFGLFILATLLIAAGGNVINDAYDVAADKINKPHRVLVSDFINKDGAINLGQTLLVAGTLLGLAMGLLNQMLTFSYVFPIAAFLLWVYNTNLKRRSLLGNLVVSFLAGLLIFNVAIFDVLKTFNIQNIEFQTQAVWVIAVFGGFSFCITFAREIVKDIQDIPGDKLAGYRTLPIVSGPDLAKKLAILALGIVAVGVGWLGYRSILGADFVSGSYLFVAILLPIFYLMLKIWKANTPKQLHRMSQGLKILMILGIAAILVFTLSMKLKYGSL